MDHRLETAAFVGELVVGKEHPQVHLVGGQHAFDALQQLGVGVGVLALENETDFQRGGADAQLPGQGDLLVDVSAAADVY